MPENDIEYMNGTWEGVSESEPDNKCHFRIVDLGVFLMPVDFGEGRIRMTRQWIRVEENGVIRVLPKSGDSWTREYHLSPPFLTLGSGDKKWNCRKLEADEVPEGFEKGVTEALAKPW